MYLEFFRENICKETMRIMFMFACTTVLYEYVKSLRNYVNLFDNAHVRMKIPYCAWLSGYTNYPFNSTSNISERAQVQIQDTVRRNFNMPEVFLSRHYQNLEQSTSSNSGTVILGVIPSRIGQHQTPLI